MGFLNVEVRTYGPGGVVRVPLRMKVEGKPSQDDIGAAYDRGYFQLRKLLG